MKVRQIAAIAVNEAAGLVGVCDCVEACVQIFDYEGHFVRQFGRSGSALGMMQRPVGIAVDSAGNWIAADLFSSSLPVFAADGSFVTRIATPDSDGVSCVCVDCGGRILVGKESSVPKVQVIGFCSE